MAWQRVREIRAQVVREGVIKGYIRKCVLRTLGLPPPIAKHWRACDFGPLET